MSKDGDKKDYEVGYCRPPVSGQFGQPGGNKPNTKGRPPGRTVFEYSRLSEEALWDSIIQAAQMPVGLNEGGQELLVPLILALSKRMANEALKGDRHARKEFFRLIEKATKGADQLFLEMQSILADFRDRQLETLQNPGTLEHVEKMNAWFKAKRHLRASDGPESWPYEDGEPQTNEEWVHFEKCRAHLQSKPKSALKWPPQYPSRLEPERCEDTTKKDEALDRLGHFMCRKRMREKEGRPLPYMKNEPVDEKDWTHFNQYVQDHVEGKENPAPWPPDYWDKDLKE